MQMKKYVTGTALFCLLISGILGSCGSSGKAVAISEEEKEMFQSTEADSVTIADEESEYEIIIFEPGFNVWLRSVAQPRGYYTQNYLETRNQVLVVAWNNRVLQPQDFDPALYEWQINYDPRIDYGYEVNYKLYNYFIYFQRKYNQRLGPWLPRI